MRPGKTVLGLALFGACAVLVFGATGSRSVTPPGPSNLAGTPPHLGEPFHAVEEIVYGPSTRRQSEPFVASDGRDFLVVCADNYYSPWMRIRGTRVTAEGAVLDTPMISIGGGRGMPGAAYGGSQYLVVWEYGLAWEYSEEEDWDIVCARVSKTGELLDDRPITVSDARCHQLKPSVASDGGGFLVVWGDRRSSGVHSIYGARVSFSGEVLDPDGIPISLGQFDKVYPNVIFDGTNYLVVWADFPGSRASNTNQYGDGDIYCARVSPSGEVLDPGGIPVYVGPGNQTCPYVASDGANSLVVWEDERDSPGDVYCARVLSSGEVLDPEGIPVAVSSAHNYSPKVVYDGANYAIAWGKLTGVKGIRCARVTPDGEVLDPDGWVVSSSGRVWSMASGSENILLADVLYDSNNISSVHGTRITASAETLPPEAFPITLGMNQHFRPCAVRNGANFAVAWTDSRLGSGGLYMTRLDFSGHPLDAATAPLVANGNIEPFELASAGSRRGAMFSWIDSRDGRSKIYGARVLSGGGILDFDGFCLSDSSSAADPALASDGTDYVAAWTDRREGRYSPHVYVARATGEGEALDPDGVRVTSDAGGREPGIAYGRDNYMLAWVEAEGYHSTIGHRVVGARVTRSGEVLDPSRLVFSEKGNRFTNVAVAFDGTNYVVGWAGYHEQHREICVLGVIVDRFGTVLESFEIDDSLEFDDPGEVYAVFDGEHFVLSWPVRFECHACRVSSAGEVIDEKPFEVSGGERIRTEVSMATLSPGHTLIVYPRLTGIPGDDYYRVWGTMLFADVPEPEFEVTASPSPFNKTLAFNYYLPSGTVVRLSVFDAMGRRVKTVVDGYQGPGPQLEIWDGTSEGGEAMPSGVYFARIQSAHGAGRVRCILAR
jgi:hypothetical protein